MNIIHGDKNDLEMVSLISWLLFAVGVVGGACQDVRQKFIQVKKYFWISEEIH